MAMCTSLSVILYWNANEAVVDLFREYSGFRFLLADQGSCLVSLQSR
jgi:hypothetical protein